MHITKDTPIYDVLKAYPETIEIFVKYGMGCAGCLGAMTESIENGCKMHGIDLEKLLKELNSLIDQL